MIKIISLILIAIGNILNAELNVEKAAKIWIEQYDALKVDVEKRFITLRTFRYYSKAWAWFIR